MADREAESVADWLRAHPGIEIITRDRANAYAEAARDAAPQAVQVADRWHLMRNLSEALQRVLEPRHAELRKAAQAVAAREVQPVATPVAGDPAVVGPTRTEHLRDAHRSRRLARYQAVMDMVRQGVSQTAIERRLGINRRTVRRWIRAGSFPERQQPKVPRIANEKSPGGGLSPYHRLREEPVLRLEDFMEIQGMYQQGVGVREIARHCPSPRDRPQDSTQVSAPRATSVLPSGAAAEDRSISCYLRERWDQGVHNAYQLFREVLKRGYGGGVTQVGRLAHQWRGEEQERAFVRFETEPGKQCQMDWATSATRRGGACTLSRCRFASRAAATWSLRNGRTARTLLNYLLHAFH